MKIDGVDKELQEKVMQMLNDSKPEDKAQAIYDAADMIVTAKNEKLIKDLTEQNAKAAEPVSKRKRVLREVQGC